MGICESDSNVTKNEEITNISDQDLKIIQLKNQRDQLFSKRKETILIINKSDNEIRNFLINKNRDAAKFALKKKKLFDNYLSQIDDKYLFINKLIIQVENAIMDKSLVEIIKGTNKLLNDLKESINLEEMKDLMQNLKENQEKNKEFSKIFEQYNIIDNNELEMEYEEYEKQIKYENNNNYEKNIENSFGNKEPIKNNSKINKSKFLQLN